LVADQWKRSRLKLSGTRGAWALLAARATM
jgi:hypothetical protein